MNTFEGLGLNMDDMVFLSIDIQPRPRTVWTEENKLSYHRDMNFSVEDLNAAAAHFHDVAVPNAVRLCQWARTKHVPRILVHWSKHDHKNYGDAPRPHDAFEATADDVVIPKTTRGAFEGSDIDLVLKKLNRKTLIMAGGQAKGCLGRTATSALAAGYTIVLIRDASFDCSMKIWKVGIEAVQYKTILDTDEFLEMASRRIL